MGLFSATRLVHLTSDKRFLVKWVGAGDALKDAIPGARKDKERHLWVVPAQAENVKELRKLKLPFTREAFKYSVSLPSIERTRIALSKATTADLDLPGFGKKPYPFQNAGILYALDTKRVIIGDPMGVGKTIQGLGTAFAAGLFPLLVITPPSLKYNWADIEVPDCLPGYVVILAKKDTPLLLLQMADVIVTNYEQLVGFRTWKGPAGQHCRSSFKDATKREVLLSPLAHNLRTLDIKGVICDEANYLKSTDAARTMAAMETTRHLEWKMLLTGTPMPNRPREVYSLIKFLGRQDDFGGYWHFMRRYCDLKEGEDGLDADGSSNEVELNTKLRSICYVRRKKSEVQSYLPPKTRSTYPVDISNRKEYEHAEHNLIEWVKMRVLKDEAFLESIKDLSEHERRAAIHNRQMDKAEAAERGKTMVMITALKGLVAEGKLNAAKEWIDNFLESGEKLIVFAAHKRIIKQLLKWYPTAARIVADDDPKERQQNVSRFQKDESIKLIICAFGTSITNSPGGLGHTLTAASDVLFLELGWTPAQHNQAEDRAHREGQKEPTTIHYLLGKKTIDQMLAEIIESKREVAAKVEDGDESVQEQSIVKELMARLAQAA